MEKSNAQRYERNLEHLESIYRQLIVELIYQAGKDWYPQNPELFNFNANTGIKISYVRHEVTRKSCPPTERAICTVK